MGHLKSAVPQDSHAIPVVCVHVRFVCRYPVVRAYACEVVPWLVNRTICNVNGLLGHSAL